MTRNHSSNEENLQGQVTLVTGGGRGLGRAFARGLSAAGIKVAVTARTDAQLQETVKLIEEAGGTSIAFTADVTDRPAMQRVIAEVEERLGPIDILVNNAAVLTPLGYDWEVDPDEWWRTMEINVRGAFLCTHAVLPGMMKRRKGRIINISSGAAHNMHPYGTAYCTSKAALSRVTNLLAEGVKEYGITAFALAPAGPTNMIEILATSPKLPKEGDYAESCGWRRSGVSPLSDKLTGRHISHRDSMDDLLQRAHEIEEHDLYTLQLRV